MCVYESVCVAACSSVVCVRVNVRLTGSVIKLSKKLKKKRGRRRRSTRRGNCLNLVKKGQEEEEEREEEDRGVTS